MEKYLRDEVRRKVNARITPKKADQIAKYIAENINLKIPTTLTVIDGYTYNPDRNHTIHMGWPLYFHSPSSDTKSKRGSQPSLDLLTTDGELLMIKFPQLVNDFPPMIFLKNWQRKPIAELGTLPDQHKIELCVMQGMGELAIKGGLITNQVTSIK